MGLFTAAGTLVMTNGLSPYAKSAYGEVPTGRRPAPVWCPAVHDADAAVDLLQRKAVATLTPAPTAHANTTQQLLNPALEGVTAGQTGPIEGRPPGPIWAHQKFAQFPPLVAIEATQAQATTNTTYTPGVTSNFNSGINPAAPLPLKFHPGFPTQNPNSVWTFNGTIPPKLVIGRYAEPILFRHHNGLPFDVTQNNGFGRHTISTHNGHHGAENDGFTGAFLPGQFYDYHWPIVLAGRNTINTLADGSRASTPNDSGGSPSCRATGTRR